MTKYLKLSEDELVEKLQKLQIIAREMLFIGQKKPYNPRNHEMACTSMIVEINKLAKEGDII